MIGVAIVALFVCTTFVWWWTRVEKVMLQRLRPTSALQVTMLFMPYVNRLVETVEKYASAAEKHANNETARITDVVLCIDRLIPLAERYLAIVEERNKPKPPPPDYGPIPDDLAAEALKESEPWARASVLQHFNELAAKHDGDWQKVRSAVMPTLDVHG